jgi:hypothetical protein
VRDEKTVLVSVGIGLNSERVLFAIATLFQVSARSIVVFGIVALCDNTRREFPILTDHYTKWPL